MSKFKFTATLTLAASLLLGACSDGYDESNDSYANFRLDVVTCLGINNSAGAEFEYLGRDDSTAVRLQSALTTLPSGVVAGKRVLLRYKVLDRQLEGGNPGARSIGTYRCTAIVTDTVRNGQAPQWAATDALKLRSLWRTGPYINLRSQVEVSTRARQLRLVADATTLNADTVECHLVHRLMDADTTYYWRDCYGSFFAGNITGKPSCRVLRVWINDCVKPDIKYYDFKIK